MKKIGLSESLPLLISNIAKGPTVITSDVGTAMAVADIIAGSENGSVPPTALHRGMSGPLVQAFDEATARVRTFGGHRHSNNDHVAAIVRHLTRGRTAALALATEVRDSAAEDDETAPSLQSQGDPGAVIGRGDQMARGERQRATA